MKSSYFSAPPATWWGRALVFAPALAWYCVIFAFSAQTGSESSQLSGAVVERSISWMGAWGEIFRWNWEALQWLIFLVRKAAHMSIFFLLAALILYGLWRLRQARMCTLTLAACALLAGLDEFHQYFVPGRDGKLTDVLIDLGGSACFILLFLALRALRRRALSSR